LLSSDVRGPCAGRSGHCCDLRLNSSGRLSLRRSGLLAVPPQAHEGMTLRIIGPTGPSRGILSFWWTRGISVPHTTLHHVSCVLSVVLLGRETGLPHLFAPNLLTGGKAADLVIRGNIVLNTLSARSTSTLLRGQICMNSLSSRQVTGLAELSYATIFVSVPWIKKHNMYVISRLDLLFTFQSIFLHWKKRAPTPTAPYAAIPACATRPLERCTAAPPSLRHARYRH
jgi:hypothetical protein